MSATQAGKALSGTSGRTPAIRLGWILTSFPPNLTNRMNRKALAFACAFVAAAGLSWYIAKRAFDRKPPKGGPDAGEIKAREAIPVPAVKFTDVTAESGITF